MMEADTGAAIADLRIRDGKRVSIFRSYTYPLHGPSEPDGPHACHGAAPHLGARLGHRCRDRCTRESSVASARVPRWSVARSDPHAQGSDAVRHRRRGRAASCRHRWSASICRASAATTRTTCLRLRLGVPRPRLPSTTWAEAMVFWAVRRGLDGPDHFVWQGAFPLVHTGERRQISAFPTLVGSMFRRTGIPEEPRASPCSPVPIPATRSGSSTTRCPTPTTSGRIGLCPDHARDRQFRAASALREREVMPGDATGAELESYVRDAARGVSGTRSARREWVATKCPWSTASLKVHGSTTSGRRRLDHA